MTRGIIHRSIAALALLAAIALPAAALGSPEPADPLEAGGTSYRACGAAVGRQSPEEAAQHAAQAEAAYGKALDTRPTEARIGIASASVDARIRKILEAEVAREEVPGQAAGIARAGEILLLDGFGLADLENRVPMTADSVVRIGSVSKQFTAVIVLRLHEEGGFRVDNPVDRWLPAESPELLAGITMLHLLTHTAGLPRDPAEGPDSIQESVVLPRVGAPGERYEYSNLGYALLGRALESVADRSFEQLLDRFVLDPAGLEATRICDERAIVPNRAQGYTWRGDRLLDDDPVWGSPTLLYAGSLCSTARDLLRWQRALHGGRILGDDAYAGPDDPAPGRGSLRNDLRGRAAGPRS